MKSKLIDLSHEVEHGMITYTGSYVDSPFHRFADGIDLSELPLESLADLEGVLVHAQKYGRASPPEVFEGIKLSADGTRPAHTILLGNRIPICEHMCGLENLPDAGFRFHAAPVKVKAFGTFPVRAYAVLDK